MSMHDDENRDVYGVVPKDGLFAIKGDLDGHKEEDFQEREQFIGLAQICRERFFAQYVFARIERGLHRLVMREIGRGDAYRVNRRFAEHLVEISVARLDAVFVADLTQPFVAARADGGHFGERMRLINARVLLAHNAESDDSDAYFIRHFSACGIEILCGRISSTAVGGSINP